MADPMKMAVSHESTALQPEDYQQILDLLMKKDPRGVQLATSLTPAEQQTFFDFQKAQQPAGKDMTSNRKDTDIVTGIPAEAAVGGMKIPSISMPSFGGLGQAVKGGAGAYLGFEGAQSVGKALGVPGPIRDLLSMMAAHKGGSMATAGAPAAAEIGNTVAPMSAAEYEAAAGHPRGAFPTPPPANLEKMSKGAFDAVGQNPNPLSKLQPAGLPPNMTASRTAADVGEQVGRGVQHDFKGVVNIQKPPVAPRVGGSPGEQAGMDSLDKLQGAMGSNKTKGNGLFRDTASDKPKFDKRNIPNPPGVDNNTPPDKYEEASKNYAELDPNYDAFDAAQQKIREALDRSRTSTLKKKK